jgi:type IX secretion system PorP/SprF family membrane protein
MNSLFSIRKETIVWLVLLFITTSAYSQQGLSYTQYIDNQTPINPTFSLLNPYGSLNTLVRKQWVGVPGAPTTYLINGSIPIESVNGSAGFVAENDVFAIERLSEVNFFFAKGIRLSETQNLAVSMSAGFRNYVANYTGVDASDPVFANNINQIKPNVGFGVMYYTPYYYLGLSVPDLSIQTLGNASVDDNTNFENHYYFTAGLASKINDDYKFKYAALVAYSKNVPVEANISTLLYLKNIIGFGVNYRSNNEIAGMFSVNYNVFHLGYAYEFGATSSNIGGYSNATHEVTLGIRFGKESQIGDSTN